MTAPVLTTARLTLRLPEERDFEAFVGFVSRDRSKWVGGPGSREDAREGFDDNFAHWAKHGYGYFHVEVTATGVCIGRVGIRFNANRPEPEVAYSLFADTHEGHGYAREAAEAVRDWGFTALKLPTLVSYIDPVNARSRHVAEAMGATPDQLAEDWSKNPDLLVYRHPTPGAYA